MLFLPKTATSHEDLFVERYDRLLSWSLQLTDSDRSSAEDLLHDAFILFTLNQPDLSSIRNLDAYLHTVLRNLHISQMRSPTRNRFQQLSILDYDSAEVGLWAVDPRDQIYAQDQLRRVCHYACARKETAKIASVLILRFFHGYYPSEIIRMLNTTRNSTDRALLLSRGEARASLDDPRSLAFITKNEVPEVLRADFARTTDGFLGELRQIIFRSRQGDCLSKDQLKHVYQSRRPVSLSCEQLAHLVSCADCLDAANKLLGLPLLSERYPTDTMNKDTSGRRGPKGGAPSGGAPRGSITKWKREARGAFEHKPKELCIAVNGYIQGSQTVSSELMEQSFLIDMPEKIGFVEVFSEQGFRLLLLNIDEPPPTGPGEHSMRVGLSDARSLELSLRFSNPWPTIHVTYSDPLLKAEGERAKDEVSANGELETLDHVELAAAVVALQLDRGSHLLKRLCGRLTHPSSFILHPFLFRPSMATAVFAVLLAVVSLFVYLKRSPTPMVSAGDLLARSSVAEEAMAARTGQVLHRVINLEERRVGQTSSLSNQGELIAQRRIEIWQSAEKGITARRLYDEKDRVVGGDWRRADGVQTLYHHGVHPQIRQRNPQTAVRDFADVWELSPSAKEFSALIGDATKAQVEERTNAYVISVSANSANSTISSAQIILNRTDLRAIEQIVVIRLGDETRKYKFTESLFEQKTPATVAPAIFEPEPELLSERMKDEGVRMKNDEDSLHPSSLISHASASAALEVEVLDLLNKAGADMGEQVNVSRSSDGALHIEGIVETEQRKKQILSTLAPVLKNPALHVSIKTVAEALREKKSAKSQSTEVSVQSEQANSAQVPADREVRAYFAGKGFSGEALDNEVRTFSRRALSQSGEVMQHAWALKGLVQRFSLEALRTLDPEARRRWSALITQHAAALKRENRSLRQMLQPIFPSVGSGGGGQASVEVVDDANLVRAVERLFQECAANDEVIRSAFSISPDPSKASNVKTARFGNSLSTVDSLAVKISRP